MSVAFVLWSLLVLLTTLSAIFKPSHLQLTEYLHEFVCQCVCVCVCFVWCVFCMSVLQPQHLLLLGLWFVLLQHHSLGSTKEKILCFPNYCSLICCAVEKTLLFLSWTIYLFSFLNTVKSSFWSPVSVVICMVDLKQPCCPDCCCSERPIFCLGLFLSGNPLLFFTSMFRWPTVKKTCFLLALIATMLLTNASHFTRLVAN